MTDLADCPAADEINAFLAWVEDEQLDDTLWFDSEFQAIIAANWYTEPPGPPEPPTGRPARWSGTRRPVPPGSRQRLTEQVMAGDHHRRQRSPPRDC
jgi:hypothetical protein